MPTFAEQTHSHIEQRSLTLESVVAPWPIAACISQHLPVGDLISLARTNIALRDSLHGFGSSRYGVDTESMGSAMDPNPVRGFSNIGFHDTPYWARLKNLAPFVCASKTHTKGGSPRPCRYCSRPVCEACIVKDSFLHPKENTFNNRCRSMCPACWDNGNVSKSRRYPSASSQQPQGWYEHEEATDGVCTCTLKNDAYLCIPCKNLQNSQAVSESAKQCHGHGCHNAVGDDARRRRICTWCHKPLPGHLGGAARLEWNQKIIEARRMAAESRRADLEEYNTRRLKLLRMSRRELRGDDSVRNDPDADTPQYVRHLDTFNYRAFMPEYAAPTGSEVYQSKKGYWMYSQGFLQHMGRFCAKLPLNQGVTNATKAGALTFARTNAERRAERKGYRQIRRDLGEQLGRTVREPQVDEWYHVKAAALEMLVVKQYSIREVQSKLLLEHAFVTDLAELDFMLTLWLGSLTNAGSRHHLESAQPTLDRARSVADQRFAIRLQEQMDREAAEALQYALFDDEEVEDESSTSSTRHSSTNRSEAGSQNDTVNNANDKAYSERPATPMQPEAAPVPTHHVARSLITQRLSSPALAVGSTDTGCASHPEFIEITNPPTNDDPPPYEPSGNWPRLPFDIHSRETQTDSDAIEEQEPEEPNQEHRNEEQDEKNGKAREQGKGKNKEEEPFMAFDFEDSQGDIEVKDFDEGNRDDDGDGEEVSWEGRKQKFGGSWFADD